MLLPSRRLGRLSSVHGDKTRLFRLVGLREGSRRYSSAHEKSTISISASIGAAQNGHLPLEQAGHTLPAIQEESSLPLLIAARMSA